MKKLYRFVRYMTKVILRRELLRKEEIKLPKTRFGGSYGGWTVAKENINKDSVIYSFGIGTDISFDLSLIEEYGCQVFAFDPTPKSIEWLKKQDLPSNFHYYEWGIADYDGQTKFYLPENENYISHSIIAGKKEEYIEVDVKRIETIMKLLNHTHVDLLKLDIEGAEYAIINDLMKGTNRMEQILVEFHHRFPNLELRDTENALKELSENGYKIFNISSSREEYSFILIK